MASLADLRKRSEGNWFWLNNQLLDLTPHIGPAGLAVYVVLAFHGNNRKNAATIYHRTIAEQSGWKLSKVKMALDLLIEVGAIELHPASKRGQANTYYLLKLPPVKPLASPTEDYSQESEAPEAATPVQQGEVSHVVADLQEVAGSHVVAEVSHVVADPSHVVAPLLINKTSLKTLNKTNATQPPAEAVGASPPVTEKFPVSGNGTTPPEKVFTLRQLVIDAIDVAYKLANPTVKDVGGVPWSPLAFTRLDRELAKYRQWGIEDWSKCVSNRFTSDDIIPGQPPEGFIPYLSRYISGPLNQYHNLRGATNGNHVSPRTARNISAVEGVKREISEAYERRRAASEAPADYGDGGSHG